MANEYNPNKLRAARAELQSKGLLSGIGLKLARAGLEQLATLPGRQGPLQRFQKKLATETPMLPVAGQIAGGIAGGIPGAALGAAGGEALRQVARGGAESPRAAVKGIAGQAALGAAGELPGALLGLGARGIIAGARRIGPGLTSRFTGLPLPSTKQLFQIPGETARLAQMALIEIQKRGVEFLMKARPRLKGLVDSSNSVYTAFLKEATLATKGQKVIPIDRAVQNTAIDAIEKGFIEGDPASDRLGMSIIKRQLQGLSVKAGKSRALTIKEANLARVQLNAALKNPKLSPQTQSVLGTLKDELDESIESGIGKDLGAKFTKILDEQAEVRELKGSLEKVLRSRNAPQVIAKELGTGSELGQRLLRFEELAGKSILEPIKQAVRALPFASEAIEGVAATGGGAGTVFTQGPMLAASSLPFLGRLFSPQALASGVAFGAKTLRLPRPFGRAAGTIATRGAEAAFR